MDTSENTPQIPITGATLIDRGWMPGPPIKIALRIADQHTAEGMAREDILTALDAVRDAPDTYLNDPTFGQLAKVLHRSIPTEPQTVEVRETPLDVPVWGRELIDDRAVEQIENAMRLPVTVAGALMPDAHVGYGIPIGGVVALEGAVAPYMVGVDIACFTGDTTVPTIDGRTPSLRELAEQDEPFGVWSCTHDGKIVASVATAHRTRCDASLIEVTLDNGERIRCTPDHKFLLRDGTYCEATQLQAGTSLMPFYESTDKEGYRLIQQNYSGRLQKAHWIVARSGLLGTVPKFDGQRTVIHHRNFDPADNSVANLQFMGDKDHSSYHRQLVDRNKHWQSPEFEAARKQALARKAATSEGHAYFAERGGRNLRKYWAEDYERAKANCAGNGARGRNHLIAKNQSPEGRARSREIAHRFYTCEVCGEQVRSGLGIHNHRRWKHGYNHTVASVRHLNEREDVYCLNVPGLNNFALSAGVFVHNCRMMMSIYPIAPSVFDNASARDGVRRAMREETRFGVGATFDKYHRRDHDVLDDSDWNATRLLAHLKDKGAAQLGTSGSGNHFVDAGVLEVGSEGAKELGLEPGSYLAFMSHSGSRGVGASIADHYSKLAQQVTLLPDKLRHLAWLPMSSQEGQEYWISMNLAGRFASACHHTIHRALAKRMGERPLAQVENHHNFCIAGDQIVPTTRGPVRMDSVQVGDILYAFDQEKGLCPTSVVDSWCSGEERIYTIETDGRMIRCTGSHPILCVEYDPSIQRPRTGRLIWKKAGELQVGDMVVCAEGYYEATQPVGDDKARLAGAFIGDGWIRHSGTTVQGYSVGFAIGREDQQHTERYLDLVRQVLPSANWHNNAPGAYGLTCSSKKVHTALQTMDVHHRSREAYVPSWLYTATTSEKLAFIAGYFDADGYVSANAKNAGRGTICSVSHELVRGLRELAISCGMRVTPVRTSTIETNFGKATIARCTLSADAVLRLDLWHEDKRVNQRSTLFKKSQGLGQNHTGRLVLPANAFIQRIRHITLSEQKENVYDLTVDHPSHSFVCEGIVVHNCWKEEWNGREVYVHRKGATPAHAGVLGIIPGSQGHPSYIVRGLGSEQALNSASHGAGRVMSRTAARNSIPKRDRDTWLRELDIELLGGGVDEAPQVYKDIRQVLAVQRDLVEPIAVFTPKIVLMSDDGKSED